MIPASGPGPRRGKATIEEVARAAGVSRQTVSNALNAPERVREATLARVMDAIGQLGYRPDSSARSLRTGERRAIGYLAPADDPFDPNPLMGGFLEALVDAAGAEGFRVLLFRPAPGARDARAVLDEVIAARQVDGFVLSDVLEGDERVEHVARAGVPFVTFGRAHSPAGAWVDVDNAGAVAAAVAHLAGLGHRRLVYAGSETGLPWMRERREGFRRAAADAGVEAREAVAPLDDPAAAVAVVREALAASSAAVARAAGAAGSVREALAAGPAALGAYPTEAVRGQGAGAAGADAAAMRAAGADAASAGAARAEAAGPTAVVAESDSLALAAYEAIRSAGLVIGTDVAVTGFGDAPVARVLHPGLTSVRLPLRAIAGEIVRRLVGQVRGAADRDAAPDAGQGLSLPGELVVRESSGPRR